MLEKLNNDIGNSIKLVDNFKNFINWKKFKSLIHLILVGSLSIYFVGTSFINVISKGDLSNVKNVNTLIQVVLVGGIYFAAIEVVKYGLRFLFHSYIQTRIIKGKKNLSKRDKVEITNFVKKPIYIFLVKTGYINSILHEEFDESDKFTPKERDEFIDEQLEEVYSWLSLAILSFVTIVVINGYYNVYVILLISIFIIIQILHGIVILVFITHIDLFERLRIKLKREKNKEHGEE